MIGFAKFSSLWSGEQWGAEARGMSAETSEVSPASEQCWLFIAQTGRQRQMGSRPWCWAGQGVRGWFSSP